jgi:hypothetical protein
MMWLPLIRRTRLVVLMWVCSSRKRFTQGPVALTSPRAFSCTLAPSGPESSMFHSLPSSLRRAETQRWRAKMRAPIWRADLTLEMTRRASSTQASE